MNNHDNEIFICESYFFMCALKMLIDNLEILRKESVFKEFLSIIDKEIGVQHIKDMRNINTHINDYYDTTNEKKEMNDSCTIYVRIKIYKYLQIRMLDLKILQYLVIK